MIEFASTAFTMFTYAFETVLSVFYNHTINDKRHLKLENHT
jgi:hypothetical protein